jgi:hypothetical protein
MKTINWKTTKDEVNLIIQIVKRAKSQLKLDNSDLRNIEMDISATHCNGTPLDLEKLLSFDEFNFAHDIYGIMDNIDRSTGELRNCFLPRCSKHETTNK